MGLKLTAIIKQGKHRNTGTRGEDGAGGGRGSGEQARSKLYRGGKTRLLTTFRMQHGPVSGARPIRNKEKKRNGFGGQLNGEKRAQFAEQAGTRTISDPPGEAVQKSPHQGTQGKGAKNRNQDRQH